MAKVLKIKKCIELHLTGAIAPDTRPEAASIGRVALTPDDFPGITPKLEVKAGDKVAVGSPLWHDKTDTDIKIVSPVAGTVAEVERGEKRKIIKVAIDVDNGSEVPITTKPTELTEDTVKATLKSSGLWSTMRQLPYDIVPVDSRRPVNIFISAWDSAPLAAGFKQYLNDKRLAYLKNGIRALSNLTTGKVYIGVKAGMTLGEVENAEVVEIEGAYPASLPSVLAANTVPVNKGETVWLMSVETVVRLAQAIAGEQVDWTFPVAVTGSEIECPKLVNAPAGASISKLIAIAGLKPTTEHKRIISGNVFVGEKVEADGYLRFPNRQVTVIPEGDDRTEFMGWASVSPKKLSSSRSFPSFFMRHRRFNPDARLNGGRRAMIMSGEYDRYIPMDIMAEYLIKAILGRDIERMEELGIYEVTPADFSAAEYADTSKLELQKIVREGLDYMIKEVGC